MNDKALDTGCVSPSVVYQPSLDEPCIFTGNHRRPVSVFWLTWFIRNNPTVKLAEAQAKGEAILDQLYGEMRKVDVSAEPIKFTELQVFDGIRQVVRLEWIIWYRFAFNVGYGSAWWAGQLNDPIPNSKREEPEDDKSL